MRIFSVAHNNVLNIDNVMTEPTYYNLIPKERANMPHIKETKEVCNLSKVRVKTLGTSHSWGFFYNHI